MQGKLFLCENEKEKRFGFSLVVTTDHAYSFCLAAFRLASWARFNAGGCGRFPARFGADGNNCPSCKAAKSASSTMRHWLLGNFVALIMPSSQARLSVSTPILAFRAACLSV